MLDQRKIEQSEAQEEARLADRRRDFHKYQSAIAKWQRERGEHPRDGFCECCNSVVLTEENCHLSPYLWHCGCDADDMARREDWKIYYASLRRKETYREMGLTYLGD